MSVISSNILAGASGQGGGYNLTKSLRFRASASAYLDRTLTTPTNNKIFTWSGWVKLGTAPTIYPCLFAASSSRTTNFYDNISFENGNLTVFWNGASSGYLVTSQVFRDPAAWYHIVVAVDTTQATAANRCKIYVNGTQVTAFSTATYPTQNYTQFFNSAVEHRYGAGQSGSGLLYFYDGLITETNFIDGQALTPSSFGETSTTTGVWVPKKYTGTYGTNGFYLPFTDTTSTSTLGTDFSGNSNTWTTNNISLTAGTTYDSMNDVPTLTSATAANYCVLNGAAIGTDATVSAANLNIAYGGSTPWLATPATFGMSSGKWYWEITITASSTNPTNAILGISTKSSPNEIGAYPGSNANGWGYYGSSGGEKYNNNVGTAYGTTFTTNDVIAFSFDADTGTLTAYKNNVSQGTMFSSLATNTYFPAIGDGSGGSTFSAAFNFGQRPFTYTPPSGFVALNTFNLPTPTIGATASTLAGKYFNPVLYTGNGGSQSVTGVGFQPDWVWVKVRSSTQNHSFNDAVRGAGYYLVPNATAAERLQGEFDSFDSDGFSLTYDGAEGDYNGSGKTYVAWNWRASNTTAVTNTAGSITSTVSANTSAGFSIVTYSIASASATISTFGHGLGVAPSMVILKVRNAVDEWTVYHSSIPTPNSNWLTLNTTNAAGGATSTFSSSSSTFGVRETRLVGSGSSGNVLAYCFAPVAGYSAFGSYTGNGSTDGPFVYTGFRPRYLMIKRTDTSNNWVIQDTSRDTYNVSEKDLYADTSGAEATYAAEKTDILSNGFKQRQTGASMNASGGTYIYMAFAENPFKYANAR